MTSSETTTPQRAADGTSGLTYDDYVRIPEDGLRHEIIDGLHHMNPAPGLRHQYVSRHLQFQLFRQIEETGFGQVMNAPVDVRLSERDVVQPDLIVVLDDNRITSPAAVEGAPDLVIEILSPSNRDYDQTLKRGLYERFGVPEYWVVDPDGRTVQQFRRSETGGVAEPAVCAEQILFESGTCRAVVELRRIW